MTVISIGRAAKRVLDTTARRKQVIDYHHATAELHETLADACTLSNDLEDFTRYARRATDPALADEWWAEVEEVREQYAITMRAVGYLTAKCEELSAQLGLPAPLVAITQTGTKS